MSNSINPIGVGKDYAVEVENKTSTAGVTMETDSFFVISEI